MSAIEARRATRTKDHARGGWKSWLGGAGGRRRAASQRLGPAQGTDSEASDATPRQHGTFTFPQSGQCLGQGQPKGHSGQHGAEGMSSDEFFATASETAGDASQHLQQGQSVCDSAGLLGIGLQPIHPVTAFAQPTDPLTSRSTARVRLTNRLSHRRSMTNSSYREDKLIRRDQR